VINQICERKKISRTGCSAPNGFYIFWITCEDQSQATRVI
jgi:hypothetical protein